MFTRRTLFFGVAALAVLAVAVVAGKKPPPPPPAPPDPAILYTMTATDRSGAIEIWVMNADGSNQTPIITYATHGVTVGSDQAWSSDNTRLVFVGRRFEDGDWDLYVSDIDGSNVTRILDNEIVEGGPEPLMGMMHFDWSPAPLPGQPSGDEWIVFSGFTHGINQTNDLYAIRSDGTGFVQLTDTPGVTESVPRFSPDGSFVVYTRQYYSPFPNGISDVYKAMIGQDPDTGLPILTEVECLTDRPEIPFTGDAACLGLDPTRTHVVVQGGGGYWLVEIEDHGTAPMPIWLPSGYPSGRGWLDNETVVYKFKNSRQKYFLLAGNVFTGEETIIASFGKTEPGRPVARH